MKIWIDLTNSPHVNFFAQMIRDLSAGHELLLTCRPLANTIELLDLFGFRYVVVGRHYGQNSMKKALGFGIRVLQLYRYLLDKGVDAAISHSSFYSPIVAGMLGIPSLYLNDNEHAAGNRISFLFADKIMMPEFLSRNKVRRQWAADHKIIQYPGVKEGIYLWNYNKGQQTGFKLENPNDLPVVFIRPEPWTAQYYRGRCNFIDPLLLGLINRCLVVLLPRGEAQKTYYLDGRFSGIHVMTTSVSLADVMENAALFIGAGGTMTREAAVLGVPTISIYQDKLLEVDRYLISRGHMVHMKEPSAEDVLAFLTNRIRQKTDAELLRKGHAAYLRIRNELLNMAESRK